MGLRAFIIKRIFYTFILIIAVISVNFLIFNLMPGNPIQQYVARLDASVRELWEQAKRLAIIIYRYRRMDMAKVRF